MKGVRFIWYAGTILIVEVCAGAAIDAPSAFGVAGAVVMVTD